ncbi:MAG: ComF family protein [Thermoleophilaceae bacterium]
MLLRRLASVLAPPICVACGGVAGEREPLCPTCRRALRWLGTSPAIAAGVPVWAPVAYDGPARELVRALKFRGLPGMAATMASQIAANAPPGWLESGTLVPVPLHPARLRKRGYNQAERLAAELAFRTGLAVIDCLERTGERGTQVGRGRADRLASIAGSVALRPDARVPHEVVLVDDVVTTGATLAACAAACGRTSVRAVAYARTPGR